MPRLRVKKLWFRAATTTFRVAFRVARGVSFTITEKSGTR